MDEAEDVVEKLLRQAVVNQRNDYDSHPEPEQLVALAEGHCNAQEAESLRDHLANCSECTQLLLDFKDFEEGNLVPEAAALTDDDIKSRREELFTATTDFPREGCRFIEDCHLPMVWLPHFCSWPCSLG